MIRGICKKCGATFWASAQGAAEDDLCDQHRQPTYYGVYRVLKSGEHRYVSRSCTSNEKLAQDIAKDLTNGEVVMPDGRTKRVTPYPHIAKPIKEPSQ